VFSYYNQGLNTWFY